MPSPKFQALFLVDGYNIVGAWPNLRKVRDRSGLEEARRVLVEAIVNYSAYQGYDTQVVFDAQYRDSVGTREVITKHVALYFTDFGETADTYIEKTCAAYRHDLRKFNKQRLIVATSDRAQELTVRGYGAEWMSADRLATDIDMIAMRVQRHQKPARHSAKRMLAHFLDPLSEQQLREMRFGKKSLPPNLSQKNHSKDLSN